MKTPPSASASPETPSAVMRALADKFAALAKAATPGPWLARHDDLWGSVVHVRSDRLRMVTGSEHVKTSREDADFIAFCGQHRGIMEAMFRAVADSAEEAPR